MTARREIGRSSGVAATTDATVTTVATFTIPADSVAAFIECRLVGRDSSNNPVGCTITGVFKRVSGTTSLVSAAGGTIGVALAGAAGLLTSLVTLDASGTDARIRVAGVVATNIDWFAEMVAWEA